MKMNFNFRTFFCALLPTGFFLFLVAAERPFPDFLPGLTGSELGLVETLQEIIIFIAFVIGARLLFTEWQRISRWLRLWIGTAVVCSLYVLLEEMSYGQHYLNWDTPDYWKEINRQNETNLHNTSRWLDQKPRLVLEIGVIIGGIIVPLLRRFKPSALPERFKIILPNSALLVTALLAIIPRFYERLMSILEMDQWQLFLRTSEVQELYFYYFVLLYLAFLAKKLRVREEEVSPPERILQRQDLR